VLYKLLIALKGTIHGFDVFRYITLRTALATLTAMGISLLLGPWIIGRLRTSQPGAYVREDVPEGHLLKAGVPTMGGLLILFAIISSTLLWADLGNRLVWLVLLTFAVFGAIGFADDWLKLYARNHKGLRARTKLWLQIAAAGAVAVYLYLIPAGGDWGHYLQFPFFKSAIFSLGLFYIPFVTTVIIGTSNGVNLTDGLDGLAIAPVMFSALAFAGFTYVAGHAKFAGYLDIVYVPGVGELAVFCGAMIGASLGFLWFNTYPAQVFMGDVGALALGAALGTVAVVVRQEIVLFVMGGVFVLETVSVMLQVASFKLTGKRIFRMAPIHHHFELRAGRNRR
jgi:phospho-N-acetylmuramoyl-pentapeptide-transferase